MRIEEHEEICLLIDKSLKGKVSPDEEVFMREHLDSCRECREYRAANDRVISALEGFVFEATPGLNAQVHRSMQQLVHEMEADGKERRRSLSTSAAAFTMSFLGSFLLWEPSDLLASYLHIAANDVQFCLLLFWVLPSLVAAALIPIVPSLLMHSQTQKGLTS